MNVNLPINWKEITVSLTAPVLGVTPPFQWNAYASYFGELANTYYFNSCPAADADLIEFQGLNLSLQPFFGATYIGAPLSGNLQLNWTLFECNVDATITVNNQSGTIGTKAITYTDTDGVLIVPVSMSDTAIRVALIGPILDPGSYLLDYPTVVGVTFSFAVPPPITAEGGRRIYRPRSNSTVVSAAGSTASGTVIYPTPRSPAPPPVVPILSLPNAPHLLTMIGQATDSVELSWSAAVPGTYPVTGYKIYRDGILYGNASGTVFADAYAIGTLGPTYAGDADPNATLPGVAYSYAVSAVDAQGNEGPQQTTLSYVAYQNGVYAWPVGNDYSYHASANYADTTGVPMGGTADICVTVTSARGIWQPSTGGNVGQWDFQAGAFEYINFALKPSVANQDWSLSIVSRAPVGDLFPYKHVNVSSYGTPVAGVWSHYSVPLEDLNIGTANFVGEFVPSGATMEIITEAGTVNWYTGTLTVASMTSGCGVDVGGFVTGGGLPTGCQVNTANQESSIGTFLVVGPNLTATTQVPANTALTCTRTAIYKLALLDLTGAASNTYWADDLIFTGVAA